MTFIGRLQRAWIDHNSLVCVGLDPEPVRLPASLHDRPDAMFEFCRDIVDAAALFQAAESPISPRTAGKMRSSVRSRTSMGDLASRTIRSLNSSPNY